MGGDGDADAARGAAGGGGGKVARLDGYPLIRFEHATLPVERICQSTTPSIIRLW